MTQNSVEPIDNRFDKILVAALRVRELKAGHMPKVINTNNKMVTAIQEIDEGHIGREYLKEIAY